VFTKEVPPGSMHLPLLAAALLGTPVSRLSECLTAEMTQHAYVECVRRLPFSYADQAA